jgi:hypothetical protein
MDQRVMRHLQASRLILALFLVGAAGAVAVGADDDAIVLTSPGFHKPGQPILKAPANAGQLKVTVRDARTGEPTFCRVTVVGADGNYYFPKQNYLTRYALTGRWPKTGLGNREGKAPIRFLGRFFYSWGNFEVDVPSKTSGSSSQKGWSICLR